MKKCYILLLLSVSLFAGAAETGPVWKGLFGKMKTIAVCAPGLPGNSSEVDLALKHLRDAGYKVKVMPNARKNEVSRKMVDAALRAADFMQAYCDPEIDAIWCVRGGNGSLLVAKRLEWEKLRFRKLPVIGFSNITELHCMMLKNGVGHILSGPSLTQLTKCNSKTVAWFSRAVAGQAQPVIQLKVIRGKDCSGYPAGGHINMYKRSYCDGNAPAADGKVIFLESPRSNPHKFVVKELELLRKKGAFDRCAAVVFGDIKGKAPEVDKIIRDFAAKVKCPVYYGFPYGHQADNFLIDFEREVFISADGKLSVK